MSLAVNDRIVAEISIQQVALRSIVGAYEMSFFLKIRANPWMDVEREAVISGARVGVKTASGTLDELGIARPERDIRIRQYNHVFETTHVLILTLQPSQLLALEDLRNGGDLDFELIAFGEGGIVEQGRCDNVVQDKMRIGAPSSEWIKQLRSAKVLDILLIEVPMPIGKTPEKWKGVTNHLQLAQTRFVEGNYQECVAQCRHVTDELGTIHFGDKGWFQGVLGKNSKERQDMNKHERERLLIASIRHYAHQAHHAESDGGFANFGRADAKLMLSQTAAVVARSFER